MHTSLHSLPFALAQSAGFLISLVTCLAAWRRRITPGGTVFALMSTFVTIWTAAATAAEGALGARISYFGAVNVTPLFLLFAWKLWSGDRRARLPMALLLWAVPAAALM